MAFPRNSLRAFLQYARTNLSEAIKGNRKVNLVIGNEAADLDSMTSSLLFAYIRSTKPPSGCFSPIYIPIINIPSSEIRLRPEFSAVCESGGITTSHLISLDDIGSGFKDPDKTTWILVDHNKLQGSLGEIFSNRIGGVIDHHEEEHSVSLDTTPEPRIVQKAGSCTSLVAQYCKESWDAISNSALGSGCGHAQGEAPIDDATYTRGWDAQFAKLALASILVDTANLTAPGRVERIDIDAVDYLESKIMLSPKYAGTWDRNQYFESVGHVMQDISHLSLKEILIKDYKEWTENGRKVGTSSMMKPLAYISSKASQDDSVQSFDQTVNEFIAARQLTVFAIMTWFRTAQGKFERELLLQDVAPKHTAAKHFCDSAANGLNLKEIELDIQRRTDYASRDYWRNFWSQGDQGKSRKQIAPMLRDALKVSG